MAADIEQRGETEAVANGVANGSSRTAPNGSAAHDLLFIDRLKAGKAQLDLQPLLIRELLTELVDRTRPLAEMHGVSLTLGRCDRVVSSHLGDRERLARSIANLIANAIQYTPRGGRVEVRGILLDRRFLVEIEDEGLGIAETERDLVFEPFFRGTAASGQRNAGLGIGLTIARAIIEAHNGSLTFRSTEDEGTTIYVELPA